MRADIVVPRCTELHIHMLVHIFCTHYRPREVVVEALAIHAVGFLHFLPVHIGVALQPPVFEALAFVLLVVAPAVGVVQRRVQAPVGREAVRNLQLRMLLRVVIRLIIIVFCVSFRVSVFSRGVVASVSTVNAVGGVVVHAIPSHAGLLLAAEETRHHLRLVPVPAEVAVVRIQVGVRAIEETIGVHLAETRIHAPVARQHYVPAHHLTEGVVHTPVECQREVVRRVGVPCVHVQRRTERGTTVGRGAHAALHINARHGCRHIRHVHPENGLALLVVERHIVHRHIDTGVVRTAHAEIGVAHT